MESAALEELIQEFEGRQARSVRDLLRMATSQGVRLTLSSAWRSEGKEIGTALTYELGLQEERELRYQKLLDNELGQFEHDVLKGPSLSWRYPQGWIRESNDLDIVLPRRDDVWAAAKRLLDSDWQVLGIGFLDGKDPLVVVSLEQPFRDPYVARPLKVDLSNLMFAGNFRGVRPLRYESTRLWPEPAKQLLALVDERFQRPFTLRDALDAHFLTLGANHEELLPFFEFISSTGSWKEWETFELVGSLIPGYSQSYLPSRAVRFQTRLHRLSRDIRSLVNPIAILSRTVRSLSVRPRTRWRERIMNLIQARLTSSMILRHGIPVSGATDPELLDIRGEFEMIEGRGTTIARTPIGSFVLSLGALPTSALRNAKDLLHASLPA